MRPAPSTPYAACSNTTHSYLAETGDVSDLGHWVQCRRRVPVTGYTMRRRSSRYSRSADHAPLCSRDPTADDRHGQVMVLDASLWGGRDSGDAVPIGLGGMLLVLHLLSWQERSG